MLINRLHDIIISINRGVYILLFFVMAASIMAASIIAIHKIAGHFGMMLPISSLVLCGISALIINFLIISVTPFLTNAYYCMLGTMIVFAATGTTCYNKYLLYSKARSAETCLSQTASADSMPAGTIVQDKASVALDEPVPDLSPNVSSEAEPILEEPMQDKSPVAAEIIPVMASSGIDIPAEDHESAISEDLPKPATVPHELLESMETLDDILDFAFAQASSHPKAAIQTYRYALERYRSDEYAPFIVIDMVNLYQSQEQYLEAMDCIYQAMELPAIQENPATRQNFQVYLSQIQALYNSRESR